MGYVEAIIPKYEHLKGYYQAYTIVSPQKDCLYLHILHSIYKAFHKSLFVFQIIPKGLTNNKTN